MALFSLLRIPLKSDFNWTVKQIDSPRGQLEKRLKAYSIISLLLLIMPVFRSKTMDEKIYGTHFILVGPATRFNA